MYCFIGRLLSLMLVIASAVTVSEGAEGLQAWMPRDVNAVARVDVARVYASPLALKEHWATKSREAFQQQQPVIPPGIDEVLCVADLDFTAGLNSLKDYAIARPKTGLSLTAMAALQNIDLTKFQNHNALTSPRGTFVVEVEPQTWLAIPQGGRQAASRWLGSHPVEDQGVRRLQALLTTHSADNPIVVAFDLLGTVEAEVAAGFIAQQDWKLTPQQREQIVALLPTVESLAVGVTIDQAIHGRCTIHFEKSAGPLAAVAQPFVATVLQSMGASGVGDQGWKWTVGSHDLTGEGPLTAAQVRRLLSVVHNPALELSTGDTSPAGTSNQPSANDVVAATQRYVRSLRTILDDLQDTLHRTRDNHALWYERSGRKIDDLSMLNVDPDALEYGGKVSSSLRYQGQAERTMNVRAGATKAQTGAGNVYNYGYVGPYGGWAIQQGTAVSPGAIDKTANQQSQEVRFSEWKQIEDGYATLRRGLSAKLMADF